MGSGGLIFGTRVRGGFAVTIPETFKLRLGGSFEFKGVQDLMCV